jgi:hypothetical protein
MAAFHDGWCVERKTGYLLLGHPCTGTTAAVHHRATHYGERCTSRRTLHFKVDSKQRRTWCPLAVDPPIFPRPAEQALCEIDPLLGFRQLLLEILHTAFKRGKPRSGIGRR